MKNVAVVIGHTMNRPGANSYNNFIEREWYFNKSVMLEMMVLEQFDICYDVYMHYEDDYVERIEQLVDRMEEYGRKYDLVIEMHYNSSSNEEAGGCECLFYHTNEDTKRFSEIFCKNISEQFHVRNRGARPIKRKAQRGGRFIIETPYPAVILEPFFGSNKLEVLGFFLNQDKLAKSYHETICEYFNIKPSYYENNKKVN